MEPIELRYIEKAGCLLWAPGSFVAATEDEIESNCNGCGTKGIGGLLVPDTIWGLNVSVVCNIHDWMYLFCETEEDEDLSDYYFKCNLRRYISEKGKGRPVLTAMRLLRANTYFAAVSLTYCAPNLNDAVKGK